METLVGATASRKEGLGYAGLSSALVIEFDFNQSLSLTDPTYPHVSVQFKKTGALAGSHSESLAFTRISYDLLDSNVHNIRITYRRQIDKINFRTDNFHFTQFESEFLDFESPSTTDWFSDIR